MKDLDKIKSISVSGVDGSGKSTLSTILYKLAVENKLPAIKMWFRFPYFFTYMLLLLARLTGLTKTYKYNDRTYTIHFFEKIKHQYKMLLIIDFVLNYIIRILFRKILGVLIIFDREGLDALIDYYVDTSDKISSSSLLYRIFMREHLLDKQFTIIADTHAKVIINRRPELIYDPKFLQRIAYYRVIARMLRKDKKQLIIINTTFPLSNNIPLLIKVVKEVTKSFRPLGYSKKFKNPYIKALFTNKYVILLTNWLIQGSFIASSIENTIRISIDLAAFIFSLMLTNNILVAIVALLIAHTLNYLFNSNIAHTRRFFRKYPDIDERINRIIKYIKENIHLYKGVRRVIIFGSSIRKELGEYSDIDLRVVYREGIKNAINAYLFITRLRFFALKNNIPLDAFLSSEKNMFRDINVDEREKYTPIIIEGYHKEMKKYEKD